MEQVVYRYMGVWVQLNGLVVSIGLVTFKLLFESLRGSFPSNLQQTQPPTLSRMGNE